MKDSPRSHKPAAPPRKAVLFGFLLRSGAVDRAALIVDRLELDAVAHLVPLLDGEELRLMAALLFAPARRARMVGLPPATLAALLRAADLDLALQVASGLPPALLAALMPQLGERRRPLERLLAAAQRGSTSGPRKDRLLAALRLRRLFTR